MRHLEQSLSDLSTYIEYAEQSDNSVSSVNVGWHIEHALLVIIKIIETVCKSDANQYKWKFNFSRTIAFTLYRFPRGIGKAPDIVNPSQKDKTDFQALFSEARLSVEALKKVANHQFFLHPIFGNLNRKNTFTMLDIHTKHHIAIIKDIIASNN
jgi:hypothetical protein